MKCTKCGNQNVNESKFCTSCGSELIKNMQIKENVLYVKDNQTKTRKFGKIISIISCIIFVILIISILKMFSYAKACDYAGCGEGWGALAMGVVILFIESPILLITTIISIIMFFKDKNVIKLSLFRKITFILNCLALIITIFGFIFFLILMGSTLQV